MLEHIHLFTEQSKKNKTIKYNTIKSTKTIQKNINYQVLNSIAIFLLTILAQIKNADAVWVCLSACFVVIVCILFVENLPMTRHLCKSEL